MTDHLLNDEQPTALVPNATANITDGYNDGDYQSETDTDKPVILELGPATATATPTSAAKTLTGINAHGLPTAYNTDYPLDMHMNIDATTTSTYLSPHHAYVSDVIPLPIAHPHPQPNTSHMPVYHQSYHSNAITPDPLNANTGYSATQIPQTVCTWPAEVDRKNTPEVVPPPIYISYVGAREQFITKETNPSWKEKALQMEKDYKKTACDRERTRMRDMNRAFDQLRSKLPISKPNGKKYSKIESLRIAINYINHLQQCLREAPNIDAPTSPLANTSTAQQSLSDYSLEMDLRHRTQAFEYDAVKSVQKDMDKELNESHSGGTWSDNSYVPNGQDQWD